MTIEMREILRVENIWSGDWIGGYDLCVNQGEVIYIQCLLEQSLNCLTDILVGNLKPDEGNLFIHESAVPFADYNSAYAVESGVYAVSLAGEYLEKATIAENIMPMKPAWHLFSRRKTEEEIKQYFEREQISFEPDTPLWMLGDVERKKLGLLKARLLHADLVIINIDREVVAGKTADELWSMIHKLHKEGMTFLILSCRYTFLSEFATRTQLLHRGRAVKEWHKVPDNVREKLRYGNFFQIQRRRTENEKYFIGLYDYDWDLRYDFWDYLRCVESNNPQIWKQYLSALVPESGVGYREGTAVVARNSQDMLFENLSIGENLTIAASRRVTYNYTGVVNKRMQKNVEEAFCREHHLEKGDIPVRALSSLQRKILSIARLEILRPSVILLELPYQGIGMDERPALQAYLIRLVHKGIKIAYFSKTMENMQDDCKMIIQTQDGKSAKIDTFS